MKESKGTEQKMMRNRLAIIIEKSLKAAADSGELAASPFPVVTIGTPANQEHGDGYLLIIGNLQNM